MGNVENPVANTGADVQPKQETTDGFQLVIDALKLEQLPLGIVHHLEQRLDLPPLGGVEMLEDEVLTQLHPYDPGFRVAVEGGHGYSLQRGGAAGEVGRV